MENAFHDKHSKLKFYHLQAKIKERCLICSWKQEEGILEAMFLNSKRTILKMTCLILVSDAYLIFLRVS